MPQISSFTFGEDSVNSEDSVSATCNVLKGDLPIQFRWYLNNKVLNDDGQELKIIQISKRISMLSIDNVKAQHSGLYVCSAQNSAGNSNFSTYLHINGIHKY